jgi:hypothetical protein
MMITIVYSSYYDCVLERRTMPNVGPYDSIERRYFASLNKKKSKWAESSGKQ